LSTVLALRAIFQGCKYSVPPYHDEFHFSQSFDIAGRVAFDRDEIGQQANFDSVFFSSMCKDLAATLIAAFKACSGNIWGSTVEQPGNPKRKMCALSTEETVDLNTREVELPYAHPLPQSVNGNETFNNVFLDFRMRSISYFYPCLKQLPVVYNSPFTTFCSLTPSVKYIAFPPYTVTTNTNRLTLLSIVYLAFDARSAEQSGLPYAIDNLVEPNEGGISSLS
jgi:hypothetical protein